MRKAFDDNVPIVRPRLRLTSLIPVADAMEEAPAPVAHAPAALDVAEEKVVFAPPATARAPVGPDVAMQGPPAKDPVAEAQARRRKLRDRLKAATRPVALAEPTPPTAVEARASALSLVSQLQAELEKATALNRALAQDLDSARAELARTVGESKGRTTDVERLSAELADRSRLIEELGGELSGLEGERDDSLLQLQAARSEASRLAEEKKALQDELLRRERELDEAVTEEERLAIELEARSDELRKARAMVATFSQERAALVEEIARLSHDKDDLSEAQKALSEIHRALAEAKVRSSTGESHA